jgi:hypothetical protein
MVGDFADLVCFSFLKLGVGITILIQRRVLLLTAHHYHCWQAVIAFRMQIVSSLFTILEL